MTTEQDLDSYERSDLVEVVIKFENETIPNLRAQLASSESSNAALRAKVEVYNGLLRKLSKGPKLSPMHDDQNIYALYVTGEWLECVRALLAEGGGDEEAT